MQGTSHHKAIQMLPDPPKGAAHPSVTCIPELGDAWVGHLIFRWRNNYTTKLATGTKPSVSNLRVLFPPCVVQKATSHVNKNALNMRHPSQKGFWGIFIGTPQHKKGYPIYIPSTRK